MKKQMIFLCEDICLRVFLSLGSDKTAFHMFRKIQFKNLLFKNNLRKS